MENGKLQGILGNETAFARAVQLANGFFERIGTANPPTPEETRTLIYDVMSALVLAKLQGRTKEAFICQEMLDLVTLTSVVLDPTHERVGIRGT
jgi:hypothetical protein